MYLMFSGDTYFSITQFCILNVFNVYISVQNELVVAYICLERYLNDHKINASKENYAHYQQKHGFQID